MLRLDCKCIGLLALCASLCGCASSEPARVPVTPDQRLTDRGASFLPPTGPNWYVQQKTYPQLWRVRFMTAPDAADAGKKIRTTTFIQVEVEYLKPDELAKFKTQRETLEFLRDRTPITTDTSGERFKARGKESTWINVQSAACLRYAVLAEEHGNPSDPSATLLIRSICYYLFRPDNPNSLVTVIASQRSVQDVPVSTPVDSVADAFVQTFKFEPAQ